MEGKDKLLSEIQMQYNWYSIKSSHFKKKALRYTIISASIAAVTTVILGLNIEGFSEYARIIALILTSFLTVLNAWNAFFNHKEMWLEYKKTATKLRKLMNNITIKNIPPEDIVVEYNRIIDEAESSEQNTIKKNENENNT